MSPSTPVKRGQSAVRSGARPTKKAKLGQNFLSDPNASRRIVEALGDITASCVIEIGPGRGAITKLLAPSAKRLIAIELDRMLAAELRMQYARATNVEIIEADVLKVDFATLVQGDLRGIIDRAPDQKPRTAKLVGNLPYYITSDILLHLFAHHQHFTTIVIMVQREVAERIAASPGTRDYGLLTVTTQLFADVENLFTLPPGAFSPTPKVHSTVLRLTIAPKAAKLGVESRAFIGFLKLAFAQKRKTLFNNLRAPYPNAAEAIKAAGMRPDIRAEAVSLDQLAALYRILK
jgi:16S rRNA (adenine1518-N6/adenine1519-N6)-dimethyltransferase